MTPTDFLIDIRKKDKDEKERFNFNLKRALNLNADISYKDTEEGHTIITVSKNGDTTTEEFDSVDSIVKEAIDRAMYIRRKKKSKNDAKSLTTNRYKLGDILVLRGKIKNGSERLVKKFEIKKIIWSVKGNPVNVLILKQLSGPNNNITMDKKDCKKYHIKYEEGLQVYSMMLNFSKLKKVA